MVKRPFEIPNRMVNTSAHAKPLCPNSSAANDRGRQKTAMRPTVSGPKLLPKAMSHTRPTNCATPLIEARITASRALTPLATSTDGSSTASAPNTKAHAEMTTANSAMAMVRAEPARRGAAGLVMPPPEVVGAAVGAADASRDGNPQMCNGRQTTKFKTAKMRNVARQP